MCEIVSSVRSPKLSEKDGTSRGGKDEVSGCFCLVGGRGGDVSISVLANDESSVGEGIELVFLDVAETEFEEEMTCTRRRDILSLEFAFEAS